MKAPTHFTMVKSSLRYTVTQINFYINRLIQFYHISNHPIGESRKPEASWLQTIQRTSNNQLKEGYITYCLTTKRRHMHSLRWSQRSTINLWSSLKTSYQLREKIGVIPVSQNIQARFLQREYPLKYDLLDQNPVQRDI